MFITVRLQSSVYVYVLWAGAVWCQRASAHAFRVCQPTCDGCSGCTQVPGPGWDRSAPRLLASAAHTRRNSRGSLFSGREGMGFIPASLDACEPPAELATQVDPAGQDVVRGAWAGKALRCRRRCHCSHVMPPCLGQSPSIVRRQELPELEAHRHRICAASPSDVQLDLLRGVLPPGARSLRLQRQHTQVYVVCVGALQERPDVEHLPVTHAVHRMQKQAFVCRPTVPFVEEVEKV